MSFQQFAQAHGLIIDNLDHGLHRCGTENHPRSKNGAYFFDGDRGWVQDWAAGDGDISWWDAEDKKPPTQEEVQSRLLRRTQREAQKQVMWSTGQRNATELLASSVMGEHNYLHRKGLGEMLGHVLPDGQLFVPMKHFLTNQIVGGQRISWNEDEREWEKKYLFGSQPKAAALVIGNPSIQEGILVEGYATGLSISKALRLLRLRAKVIVCFNDSNMITIAKLSKGRRFCFADHDKSGAGESAAQATGLPYCMSPIEGEDANDVHVRAGINDLMVMVMQGRELLKESLGNEHLSIDTTRKY